MVRELRVEAYRLLLSRAMSPYTEVGKLLVFALLVRRRTRGDLFRRGILDPINTLLLEDKFPIASAEAIHLRLLRLADNVGKE